MGKLLIYALIVLNSLACGAAKTEKMNEITMNKVVQEYVDKTTAKEDVELMKKILEDNIADWVKEYSGMGFYKEEDYLISDMMIFGKDKDKVLILVYALLADSNDGEVKLITGKLGNNDTWAFQFTGKPNFYYEYSEDKRKGVKLTEKEIVARTIDKLVEDGLVTFYDEVSQDYVAKKWF